MLIKALLILFFSFSLLADQNITEQDWGIAASFRTASIPYATKESTVSSFVPLLFYENKYFFLDGLEGGVKFYENDTLRFSILGRMRFVDIPSQFQNEYQGDTVDFGLQSRYKISTNQTLDLEFLQDPKDFKQANLRYSYLYESTSLEVESYAALRYKSSDFNTYYYALNQENIGSGTDVILGLDAKYHVHSNLYLLLSAKTKFLDKSARHTATVNKKTENEVSLGFGFFNDKTKKRRTLKLQPYIRVAQGLATPSNLNEILSGNTRTDEFNNQLTSFFYGYPLTDNLFTLPLDIFITPGFVWHYESQVQSSAQEYVLAIKLYYTIALPIRVRIGAAEGLSYVNKITYIEESELEAKGYLPSKLLNFIDLSLDVQLGDIFGRKFDNIWLGYSIHHRSAIFETASQFGRIKGGSNYNTIYLQFPF